MAWLVAHMWMVLAGATVFALFLGWSVRGILLTGKMRKAIVDKDVALTELDQARDEIERLFAAQRAQRGEGGNVADASARKISDLTTELQKAKTELATLKATASKAAASAPAGGVDMPTIVLPPNRGSAEEATGSSQEAQVADPAASTEEPESPTLVWRNRHLEARVQHLESQLAEQAAAPAAAAAAIATPETESVAEPSADEAGLEKLKWQADYLKQRVEALEAELAKAPAETPVAAEEDLNEEMARLRWRNRFLEGRLAYFEGGAEEVAAEAGAGPAGAEAVLEALEVEDTAADMTEAVEAMAEDLSAAEALADDETDFAAGETAAADEDEEERALAEAFGTETAEDDEDDFEDVSDDEEESLAEADHADEDVLSDEEYDEEDFVEEDEDESEDAFEADAEEADESDDESDDFDDDDDETDEQDVSYDEESDDDDEADEDDESDEDDDVEEDFEDDAEDEFEDEDDDESEDDEAYDEADEDLDESEDEYEADAEESSDEDDDAWDEADDDAENDGEYENDDEELDDEESDEDSGDDGVAYEPEETVVTERPMAMNGPVEGHPDDLTLIGGIGPKIQILLNELGVWHYDQIAEWTPENVAWVDEHLNFNGRIAREGWVEQAAVLVRDAENA